MNKKLRFVFPAILMIVSFSACAPPGAMPVGSPSPMPEQVPPASTDTLISTSIQTILPTIANTMTNSATLTSTSIPNGYELVDWREPTEVITPENMDRVERIGQLRFMSDVSELAWSPEGSKLAVFIFNINGSEIFIMDSLSFTQIYQFNSIYLSPIAFSPDGKILQIGLPYIDMTTGKIINKELMGISYPGSWTDIDFSPDGKYKIIMGTDYGMIGYSNKDISGHSFGRQYADAMHVSISRDSELFAVNYSFLNYTELWDPNTVRPIRKLELKGMTAQGKPRFSNNGSSIFFTGQGTWENQKASFIQEWDYITGRPLDVQLLPDVVVLGSSMDLSPSSDMIIFGGVSGGVYIMKTRDCHAIKSGKSSYSTIVTKTSFRPDGKMFATIEDKNQGTIDLWGIPDSGGANNISTPTVTGTPSPCPKIPMTRESLTPEEGWQSDNK